MATLRRNISQDSEILHKLSILRDGIDQDRPEVLKAYNEIENYIQMTLRTDRSQKVPINPCAKRRPPHKRCVGRKKTKTLEDDSSDGSVYGVAIDRCLNTESAFQAVLRINHVKLIDTLDVCGTNLLDHLRQESVITQSDDDKIRQQLCKKSQARHLVLTVSRYGPKVIAKFIEALPKNNYEFLLQDLSASVERQHMHSEKRQSMRRSGEICPRCQIIENVLITDVIDDLYTNKVISLETCDQLHQSGDNNKRRSWETIFKHVVSNPCRTRGLRVLKEAVNRKYNYIAQNIDKENLEQLHCICTQKTNSDSKTRMKAPTHAIDNDKLCSIRKTSRVKADDSDESVTHLKQIRTKDNVTCLEGSLDNRMIFDSESEPEDDSITLLKQGINASGMSDSLSISSENPCCSLSDYCVETRESDYETIQEIHDYLTESRSHSQDDAPIYDHKLAHIISSGYVSGGSATLEPAVEYDRSVSHEANMRSRASGMYSSIEDSEEMTGNRQAYSMFDINSEEPGHCEPLNRTHGENADVEMTSSRPCHLFEPPQSPTRERLYTSLRNSVPGVFQSTPSSCDEKSTKEFTETASCVPDYINQRSIQCLSRTEFRRAAFRKKTCHSVG